MSHHWERKESTIDPALKQLEEDLRNRIDDQREVFRREYLGQFPHGQLDEADKGRFTYQVTADPPRGVMAIQFNKPMARVGFTLAEARELIDALTAATWQLRGISPT